MSQICREIHELFNGLERRGFPYDSTMIPRNGIYVMFEKGEPSHGCDRIVRVGTHRGDDKLRSRLKEHYITENKDRSIFRKNIGLATLNKRSDAFLEQWNLDLTTNDKKNTYKDIVDFNIQIKVENEVSEYIRNNISFTVFEIKDRDTRLAFESKIISTVSLCDECCPSDNWLGLYSPKEKIRKSGLWLEQGLYKEPLSEADIDLLRSICCKNCVYST
jgi:hypothetical protein